MLPSEAVTATGPVLVWMTSSRTARSRRSAATARSSDRTGRISLNLLLDSRPRLSLARMLARKRSTTAEITSSPTANPYSR
jgi:hypothetical protein